MFLESADDIMYILYSQAIECPCKLEISLQLKHMYFKEHQDFEASYITLTHMISLLLILDLGLHPYSIML